MQNQSNPAADRRGDHGHQREQQVNNEMPVRLTPFHADEKSDSEQRSGCGHHDEKENQEATEILLLRYLAYFALRCRHYCHPIKRKDNDSDCIPTCNCRAPDTKMSPRGKENRRTGGQSQPEAMPRILTRNKIDKAHLSGSFSLSRTQDIPTGPIRNATCAVRRGDPCFSRARTCSL